MEGWDKVVPQFLREMLSSLDPKARDAVEELRLREGFPLAVVQAGEEWTHPAWRGRPLTEEALRRVLETAGRGSVHTVLDQLRSGYVTAAGGVRVGICSEGATREESCSPFVGLPLWPFGCPTLCRGWRALCCPSWRRGENSPIP